MEEPLDAAPRESNGPSKGYLLAIRIENVLVGLLMVSILLNFVNVPGTGIINILSWSSMAMLYFAVWQLLFKKQDFGDTWSLVLVRATAFVLAIAFMGILFGLMYWPNAGLMMQAAAVPGFVLWVVAFGARLVGNTIDPRAIIWVLRRLTPVMIYIGLSMFLGVSL